MTEPKDDSVGGWFRSNRAYYGLLAVLLLASLGYSYLKPKWALQARLDTWALRAEVLASPGGAFAPGQIAETLAKASANDQVYGWVLLQGFQDVLSRSDLEALPTLIRASEDFLAAGHSTGIQALGPDGPIPALQFALSQGLAASSGANASVPETPTPKADSPHIKLSLTINGIEGYEVVVGLFPAAAPAACETFLGQVQAGSWAGKPGQRSGSFGIVFKPEPVAEEGLIPGEDEATEGRPSPVDTASEGLAPEIAYGYFHQPGSLSYAQMSGGPNQVDPESLEFTIQDAYHLDGRTTVFGKVISGLEALTSHPYSGPSSVDTLESIRIDSAVLLN